MELIIETDKGRLQLFPNQDFYITRQIFDITDLNTRNGDITRQLTIPATPENLNKLEVTDSKRQTGINGSITINSKLIANNVSIFYNNVTKGNQGVIEIQLYINNSDLFEKTTRPLSDLDLSAYDFTLDQSGADGIKNNTTGVVYATADWFDKDASGLFIGNIAVKDWNLANDVKVSGFFIYCKTLLTEIVEQAGFTLDDSNVDDSNYDTVALACPVPDFLRTEVPAIFALVDMITGALPTQVITGGAENIEMVVNTDVGGLWSAPNDEYTIATNNTIDLIVIVFFLHSAGDGTEDSKIQIREDNITIKEIITTGKRFVTETIKVTRTTSGTMIYSAHGFADGTDQLHIIDCSFEVSTAGSSPSEDIVVSDRVPDMTQSAFMSSLMRMFNLIMTTNSNTGAIGIASFDNLYQNAEQDLSLLLMENQEQSNNDFSGLFRTNHFKYSGDFEGYNSTQSLDDNRLEKEGDLVVLEFIAPRLSEIYDQTEAIALLGTYSVDLGDQFLITITVGTNTFSLPEEHGLKIGDWIAIEGQDTKRIISLGSSTTGTVAGNWTGSLTGAKYRIFTLEDNEIGPTIVNILTSPVTIRITAGDLQDTGTTMDDRRAYLDENTQWTGLLAANYENLMLSLNSYKMLEAWLYLDVFQFSQLDLTRPVFLQQYNAHFFISILEQWQPDKPTRVQLFRL